MNMRSLVFILFSFFSINIFANTDATAFKQLLASVTTIQADFDQNLLDDSGNSLQTSTGNMSIERPGKFRWNILLPFKQLLISDGTQLWIYDVDLEQVTRKKLEAGIGDMPALLLSGPVEDVVKFFDIKKISDHPSFELRTKDKEALFETIKIKFNQKQIQEMRLADTLGQETVVKFKNIKINEKINKKEFEFTPPKGVDVISYF